MISNSICPIYQSIGNASPSLNGKLIGMAFWDPTINVVVVNLTIRLEKVVT